MNKMNPISKNPPLNNFSLSWHDRGAPQGCQGIRTGTLRRANPDFSPRDWKGGALQAADKRPDAVILSVDSLSAAHDGQKLDKENQCPLLSS
jgi:hypothetical protein